MATAPVSSERIANGGRMTQRRVLLRLTKKLAEKVDGIDLSRFRKGDKISLPPRDAMLLVAEGWAVELRQSAG